MFSVALFHSQHSHGSRVHPTQALTQPPQLWPWSPFTSGRIHTGAKWDKHGLAFQLVHVTQVCWDQRLPLNVPSPLKPVTKALSKVLSLEPEGCSQIEPPGSSCKGSREGSRQEIFLHGEWLTGYQVGDKWVRGANSGKVSLAAGWRGLPEYQGHDPGNRQNWV